MNMDMDMDMDIDIIVSVDLDEPLNEHCCSFFSSFTSRHI